MSEFRRPSRFRIRAFQPLARFHRFRAGVSALLLVAMALGAPSTLYAGDILRGGASAKNATRNAEARANAGAEAAQAAKVRAQDRLARTTRAVNDMRALQAAARAAAGAGTIPNGLAEGGLKVLTGPNAKWQGANAPTASGNNVNITQTAAQALLHWETFNVGSQTTVNFDQSAGGSDSGKWIAFNKVFDPAARPSEIRGKINAQGQVYIINQNGIVFGAGSQINTRALVASTLPINDNLITNGLLNNKDAQFLFSALEVPGGSDGTPTFTPTDVPEVLGDIVVERGAKISSPELAGGNGGRVMLVGANVRNEGEISTPAGQTILAAGLQVGFQAHNSSEPSLRGLDAWVGSVGDYAGTVTNSGLVEAKTGSILIVGKQINQSAILESTTSVNINGRIDLLASYGAVSNPNFDNSDKTGGGAPIFLNQFTGSVFFGPNSLTRIVPDYESTKSVPGTKLAQNSKVNIDANIVNFAPGSTLFSPSGEVRIRAGVWPFKDDESNNRTIFNEDRETAQDGLNSNLADGGQRFFYKDGFVQIGSGSILDVSGTPDVFVPMDQYIREIQLRGTELADSPLQRKLDLRGKTLTVDLRRSGTYGGRFWIGTPLGDATGLANIIERNVAQLTTRGGTIEITSGSAINVGHGSEINVAGGYTRNEGGIANTTRLLRNGQILDISAATPDVIYNGLFQETTSIRFLKWGIEKVYHKALSPLARTQEPSYIEGAAGGSLKLAAPLMELAGKIVGNTISGPRQLETAPAHSSLNLAFRNQKKVEFSSNEIYFLNSIASAPKIVLAKTAIGGLNLSGRELGDTLVISPELVEKKGGGFGILNIDNTDGTIVVPKGSPLELPAGGFLALKATNVEILSPVTIPGGTISILAYNYSPFTYTEKLLDPVLSAQPAPAVVPGYGTISVGPSAILSAAGTLHDERHVSTLVSNTRRALDGGSVALEAFSILMDPNSGIDASGGLGIGGRGKISKGNGGSISILAGKDPVLATSAGGNIQLPGTLKAFSALKGGSLRIQAPEILLTGKPGDSPVLSQGSQLALSPSFFQNGGFTEYSLLASGKPASTNPGILVSPGTVIHPTAQTLVSSRVGNHLGRIAMNPTLLPLGVRPPASLNLEARGYNDDATQDIVESIGSIVLGVGAVIQTDPLGKVSLRGQTLSIFGTILAPAGKISLQGDGRYPLSQTAAAASNNAWVTLYLAPTAKLLAEGTAILTPDPFGRRTGQVLDGGTINLKGNILAERGAIMGVSGSSDQLDTPPSRLGAAIRPTATMGLTSKPWGQLAVRTQVDSNGGAIILQGSQMLLSDATLRGFAGSPSATGGLLSVSSGAFLIESGADTTMVVTQSGPVVSAQNSSPGVGKAVLDADGNPLSGKGYFSASSFSSGGFDSLDLGFEYFASAPVPYGGNLEFVGPISINAPGSIRLAVGGVVAANGKVSLSAPYIAIGQEFRPPIHPNDPAFIPFKNQENEALDVMPTTGSGSLGLNARLVDVGTTVLKNINTLSIAAANGDIRGSGSLNVAGAINLTASQIYPTTLAKFEIFAYGDAGTVQINQSGIRALPLSAGGSLSVYAKNIINAGTLRAPFGSITLGWDGSDANPATEILENPGNLVAGSSNFPVAQNLILRAGSTNSISAIDPLTGKGILVPFGLSPDGNSWIDPRGVNVTTAGMPEKKIRLSADSITQEPGSAIDLRGGGDLLAYRWISGPGGSADILGTPTAFSPTAEYSAAKLVSYNGKTYSSRLALDSADFNGNLPTPGKTAYWLEIPESYAIVPGFGSEFAPYNPFSITGSNAASLGGDAGYVSSLKLGDRIVFDGNSVLPAGSYTLLPRRYGLMPGAYLVTPISGSINQFTNAEGAAFASAYRTNSFSTPSSAPFLRSNFEILAPAVLAARAEYETYRANTFIPEAAAALRTVVSQPLPRDSASLAIQGLTALALRGNVLSQSNGGRGANIDISSTSSIAIGDLATISGGVALDASRLNSWGASSLLVGGLRRNTAKGTVVDMKTDSITLDGSLAGPDLILASKTSLILKEGSSMSSPGNAPLTTDKLSIDGQGALVRVSSDANAAFARAGTGGKNEPNLTVEAGASLSGTGVILDSTKSASISRLASVSAESFTLGSRKIVVDFDGDSNDPSALILGGDLLSNLSTAQNLKLNSYSSIDFNGSGTLGSANLKSLSLSAGGILGLSAYVTLEADRLALSNPLDTTFSPSELGSILAVSTSELDLGAGTFRLAGFNTSILRASKGVLASGSGTLRADGALLIEAPAVAASRLTNYEISAANDLEINKSASTAAVSSELGASLSLIGSTVVLNSDISLPSGLLKIQAKTGDVTIGSKLSVDGSAHTFYDTTRFADAGSIVIQADAGDIVLGKNSMLSVSGATSGGRAGSLQLLATQGEFQNSGSLLGKAAPGFDGGSFQLDINKMPDFGSVNTPLEAGGFTKERIFRVRSGDVAINQSAKSHAFELAADGGSIAVSTKIDASGKTGGRIALSASGSLTLADGAELSVAADDFNSSGKGGEIFLAAGSQQDGVVDSDAKLNLEAGSLDLSVASYNPGNYGEPDSSAFEGKFQGVLHLRAPRSDSAIQIDGIASTITGASAIVAEGYKLYDITGSEGTMDIALRDLINSEASAFMENFAADLFNGSAPENFVLAPGVEISNRNGDLTLGLANPTGIDNIEGKSAADWDLSKMRYGSKNAPGFLTLRASGDVVFNNSLSDGFASVGTDDPTVFTNGLDYNANGHSSLWLAQLQTINPDLPLNLQSWSYTITAGADLSGASAEAVLSTSSLPGETGSVRVGEFYPAKPNSSDGSDDQSIAATGQLGITANSLRINLTEIDETTYVLDADGNPLIDADGNFIVEKEGTGLLKDLGTRFEVVRTGTGDIRVNAARDIQLRNQFATIYTAGVAIPESTKIFSDGDFVVPVVNFDPSSQVHPEQPGIGAPSQNFTPQWAMAGGNLKIAAGNDIARVTHFTDAGGTTTTVFDSSHQITSNWLYRRSHVDATTGKFGGIVLGADVDDTSASTTWWIDYSNFFQGFGALGGGNVELAAARDVVNADAVAPTNARMAGLNEGENTAPSLANLLEYGGGDVSIRAGRNIDGGLYYVERGQGLLNAGAAIKTNAARSPSLGLLNRFDETDFSDPAPFSETAWLPTALFIGKGAFEVAARNDVLLGPLSNAFMLPAGLGNKFWYKTYFSTFSPDTSVNVASLGGSVTFRTATFLPSDSLGATSRNILAAWMDQQNLFSEANQGTSSSNFQPWARLTESDLTAFSPVLNLIAPTLKATAFTGDLNVIGNLILSPAAKGTLELIAGGSMNGLQVAGETETTPSAWISSTLNLSDANPSLVPSALAPLSYYAFAGASGALYESGAALMNNLADAIAESGSYAGNDAAIDLKIKRHGTSLLHAGDTDPVKIYAKGGDFSGFNVFTPKQTRLASGGDITDVSIYIQNLEKSDVSIVAAAGDILPYNESSKLRSLASDTAEGNAIFDLGRLTASGKPVTAMAGDIQISGPGILEVLAGRNLDLGTGENLSDGTGVGIASIGNSRNPNLPFEGASVIALAGITGRNSGAALGLANSQYAFSGLKNLEASVPPVAPAFPTPGHEAIAGLQTLFAILQTTGKKYPETASYEPGLTAVEQAFATVTGSGDIFTRARNIRTVSGGSIAIAAPKGGLTMASDIYGNPLTPPGIVTEYGGSVSIITDGDVDIGRARIFTLRGGDMTIWSTTGDIAAGSSPKTVVTAPPTRVLIDSPSADVATDLGGLATGGGIGVLAAVDDVEPGNVYLLAPEGTVDAGDAGIQSTGNLNIAAVAVVNADNISTGGASAGVPSSAPAAPAPVAVSPGASSSTAATASAAENMSSQEQGKKDFEDSPSLITVEVLGYGGGSGDKEEEEEG